MADDLAAIPPPGGLPPGRAVRELGRAARSTGWHCAASAAADAGWVARALAAHAPGLPVFANLRAGAWHVQPPAGTGGRPLEQGAAVFEGPCSRGSGPGVYSLHTCRFKSTDGHATAPQFPLSRLNLHVATTAAAAGGAAVVDATRKGKAFPDALSRTIPAWCAVLNRVARPGDAAWHALHTPPWVPPSEADTLAARVREWAEALTRSGVDVDSVSAALAAPLVPVWVSRSGVVRPDGAAAGTPLYLVSASDPHATRAHIAGPGYDVWFDYVPGGGDDEEAWAKGVRASTFWAAKDAFLAAGPAGWDAAAAAAAAAAAHAPRTPPQAPGPPQWHAVCGSGVAVGAAGSAAAARAAAGAALVVHIVPSQDAALGPASDAYLPLVVRPRARYGLLGVLSPAAAAVSTVFEKKGAAQPPHPLAIIVADDDGDGDGVTAASSSTAVAVAAAVLVACFSAPPRSTFTSPFGTTRRRCGCPAPQAGRGNHPASRADVRDRVAAAAACVPGASPSKDAVKQVFMFVSPVPGRKCVECGKV